MHVTMYEGVTLETVQRIVTLVLMSAEYLGFNAMASSCKVSRLKPFIEMWNQHFMELF